MKLEEAIEIVQKERSDHHSFSPDIIGQAEQLLIEAGKLVAHLQSYPGLLKIFKLPGETQE